LEISFPDDQIRRLFERRTSLEAQFGCELAKLICRRMGVLQEAKRLSSIPTCRPAECRSEKHGCWSVALGDRHRLAFYPIPPLSSNEPAAIRQIQIVGVISS
jgi:plasmid maintenance system killer protein